MDWREMYRDKFISLEEAADKIPAGAVVCASMGIGVPYQLLDAITKGTKEGFTLYLAMAANPIKAYLPQYSDKITVKNWFLGPVERVSMKFKPNLFYQPVHLSDMTFDRIHNHKPDVILLQVTPPDENGMLSQGVCPLPVEVITDDMLVLVQVNDQVPYVPGEGTMIEASRVDFWTEASSALYPLRSTVPGETETKIAGYICDMVRDGACIQLGIGNLGTAVGTFLKDKKHLGIHSEMFVEAMVDLIECGAVDNSQKQLYPGKSVFGFAAGPQRLYDFMNGRQDLLSRPFAYVNDPRTIAQNDNVVSINAAMEIDLTGQVCAESIGLKQYSGTGGQYDFVKGAHWSKGGQSFIAMPSTRTDKEGKKHSKISLSLPAGAAVTTLRSDVQYVVTEYGIVSIQNQPIDERAKRLISIAHPDFREELIFEAKKAGLMI